MGHNSGLGRADSAVVSRHLSFAGPPTPLLLSSCKLLATQLLRPLDGTATSAAHVGCCERPQAQSHFGKSVEESGGYKG